MKEQSVSNLKIFEKRGGKYLPDVDTGFVEMKFVRLTGFVLLFLFIFANLALSDPQVVFTGGEPGNWEIYLLEDVKGNQLKPINLTQHPANESEPSWSPDGKKIAFISDRDGGRDIYIMDIDTREVENITNNPAWDSNPDWCPKGRTIAFTSDRDSWGDIYIIDLLTKEAARLTDNMMVYDLAWTPDGEELAYASKFGGKEAIYLMNPYGKTPVSSPDDCEVIVEQPPPGTEHFQGISFSPDQTMITFFVSQRLGGGHDIYTMDLSKKELKNLTHSPRHDRFPCWSPDGKFIAFSSDREGSLGGSDIYFMTPEGKIIKQLKLSGYDLNPDIFDPDFVYSVSPFGSSKACTWGEIKR